MVKEGRDETVARLSLTLLGRRYLGRSRKGPASFYLEATKSYRVLRPLPLLFSAFAAISFLM